MENEAFRDEVFRRLQKDVAALARMSGKEAKDCSDYVFRRFQKDVAALAQEVTRESTSESESESIESLPPNSCGAADRRIPLEVWRLRGDEDANEWKRSVSWATNPLNVVNPNFVRRSKRRVGPQANSGKTA